MLFRYHVTPQSPLRTQLMSDTFFGHFCWALRYREGESFLSGFLESYDRSSPGPVLFSSAFVSGMLPRPVLPSPDRHGVREFVRSHFGKQREDLFRGMAEIKKWNKQRFLTLEQWLGLKQDYSDLKLYEYYYKDYVLKKQDSEKKTSVTEVSASNTISRISGTVQEGGGFFQRDKVWYIKGIKLDLYAEVNDPEMESQVNWFLTEYLPATGFGADKSIGMGALSIKADKDFDESCFLTQGANARLSLSLASFPGMDTIDAFYRLRTKFGKLGGNYSFSSPTSGNPKPFKKPVLMYDPGAVFFCENSLNNRDLLKNVHSDPKIRHCGIPITLGLKIED